MTRDEFTRFVADALEDVIRLAEERCGKPVLRNIAFQWLGSKDEPTRECIVETIVDRVFVDDEHIYPCVDMGVMDLLADGTPLVRAGVAGFTPQPFGKNWTDRQGPFVRVIGNAFLARMAGKPYPESALISFLIPDMANLK
ncbi:MAG TPA: hypothetical protein VGI19_03825 [Candidatus Cybelea sp.]|jgi:hypothetical protein